jgi:Protein of unknown function (DUF1552)
MMRNWNRREFTRNAAMLTLFSPFIGLLEPSVARAQAATGQAKYLLIMTSNGTDPNIWQPLGGSGAGGVNLSPALSTLGPIKNDVILLNQFDSKGTAGNHGSPGGLSAAQYNQTQSLDFFVADDLRSRGILTQVPSLHLGGVKGQQGISFRNNALQVPQFDVSEAFRTIFDGTAPPPPAAPTTPNSPPVATGPSETQIRLLRRQSVLDAVSGDISQLERAFNGLEKEKLGLHIASIRELETRIGQQLSIASGQTATPVTGGGAPAPTFISPVACDKPSNLATNLQPIENSSLHLQLATTAFACDITRVAHVEFGHHQSCPVNIPGAQGDWHNDFMHASTDRARLVTTEQFVSTQFVNTVNRLKATQAPDGQGTLYDQTFMIWVREMGDAVIHAGNNMPFVVAGRAGGYLRNGNAYLTGGGAFHLRVLMAAAQAMGAVNTTNFGDKNASATDRTAFDGLRA